MNKEVSEPSLAQMAFFLGILYTWNRPLCMERIVCTLRENGAHVCEYASDDGVVFSGVFTKRSEVSGTIHVAAVPVHDGTDNVHPFHRYQHRLRSIRRAFNCILDALLCEH
jgi:hypothetical protein